MRGLLALGDSYTIGEGSSVAQSFPNRLAADLGLPTADIIGITGWTAADLLAGIVW